eukprot:TRINITY_DN66279_c7_g9_i1.p1 TRINITY_DN66279_c7_g9~~TRINITY_DN66279_c7_g9_i1.p1  ORF type:complete len:1733 (+),score=1150.79 TRINITY_DN66279_c7_g9_i1:482-5680(+)
MSAANGGTPAPPVGFKEVLSLTQLGINQAEIKFKNVTLESNKFISVREETRGQLAIITTASRHVLRLPVKVDSAIMNPVSKVVALRSGSNLQIYNLEMKSKMKSTTMEGVVYWRWISPKIIAIVSGSSVYHWTMDGGAEPKKVFDRSAFDGQVQIINYASSADDKWLILGGIARQGQGVRGVLQVYSVDAGKSQPTMDAHAACFANITIDGRDKPSTLFCFTKMQPQPTLNVLEVGVARDKAFKTSAALRFKGADFPVAMLADNKYGVVFIISKAGLLFVYELQSGKCIFAQQAARGTMFSSAEHEDGGIVTVDQTGRVSHFYVDRDNVVQYICKRLNDLELGINMAKRYNLPGAEPMFKEQFERLMAGQRVQEAMQLAASSPQGVLRNMDTINRFKQLPTMPGQKSIVLQYFSMLLSKGKLNAVESIELARPVLNKKSPAGLQHIQNWLKEDKLECSEDLGDLLKQYDIKLALSVFLRAKVPEKVIGCFLAMGAQAPDDAAARAAFQNIFKYSKQADFQPDYALLVQQLLRFNRERAKDLGLLLIRNEDGPRVDVQTLVNTFMQANDVKNTTNILLEYLRGRGDREEDADLQTKLLEINLMSMPQVANAIMESEDYSFSHYDKVKIAQLCENAGLYQRALEHYEDLADIKRVLGNAPRINAEFLLEFFGRMAPEDCLECLHDLLKYNLTQNIRLVVEIAKKWNDYLTPAKLIALFEEFQSYNGLYFYLGSFVNFTEDADVIFKYIKAAVKLGQLREVERVCRDNEKYNAEDVKAFLIEEGLKDPRPLIHVCDRHGYVDELTSYLYKNSMYPFIEAYVQRMNSKAAPAVIGALLDLNANEDQIQQLISSVRPPPDDPEFIARLVEEVGKRNRLKLLRNWLEQRKAEGSQDTALHNGLAKIAIDTNNNPQHFLTTNTFYDPKEIGQYCESRDPHLSFIAYRRAGGECDDELIAVTTKNGFFKDLARYLVERQDGDLWAKVLAEDNEERRQLIDQVVATALPESQVPEEVSATVKAFMAANLPKELIELLEKLILHGPSDGVFHKNRNLQNLLILTAIKADKSRVLEYVTRLDYYDGPDIAKIAVSQQYQLYEEAFFIYKKFEKGAEAISVLLDDLDSIERASEFAEYWDKPDVWSILGKAQLDANMVAEAIASLLRAQDPSHYREVLEAATQQELFQELIEYILMARAKVKETVLDNALIHAYAKTNRLADLEEFISAPNVAKLETVGDQCLEEELYEAAKVLFSHINNNAKLALSLVKLKYFQEAVDAARKANAISTWKFVCFSCVDAEKFRLAAMCGVNVIVYNDHLLELVRHYETAGHFEQVIHLLEQGVNLERAHQGIFTQLGILYAKHREEKLMEHIKSHWQRLNIPTLLSACKANQHWPEAVFLYCHYDQYDNAVDVIIEHSAQAWAHESFMDTVLKVSNTEIYYRAINFYLNEHPMQLNDLLLELAPKLDHPRVVSIFRSGNNLPLVRKYLLHVQSNNIAAVNEAVNKLYLEAEDYKSLRSSIDTYDAFDQIALAQRLEGHSLLEFRRLSAYLYKMNKRFKESIKLSKQDRMWQDCMETVAESKDKTLAEDLLRFFVDNDEKECFGACLFACYELLSPDVVLELAWRHNLMHFSMPYMIQTFRHYEDRVEKLEARLDAKDKKEHAKDEEEKKRTEAQATSEAQMMGGPGFSPMLALPAPPMNGGGMGGGGMGMNPPPMMGGMNPNMSMNGGMPPSPNMGGNYGAPF